MSSQGKLRADLLTAASESRVNLDNEIDPLYISLTSGILLDLLTAINAANGTRHFVDPADNRDDWYAYTTRNRQWKLGAASVDAALSAASEHVTAIDGWRVTADTVVNEQIATVDEPRFPLTPIEVWTWNLLPPLPLTLRSTDAPLHFLATYSDYVLPCPVLIIVSSGDALATQTLLHHGYSSDITIASTGTTKIKALSVIGRQAVREPEITHTALDTTSARLPRGVRAGPEITGDFVGPHALAVGISEHMVWRYANPTKRPSLTVENWLPTAFQIDLFDLITMTSVQLKATTIRFEITGLSEVADRAPSTGSGVHWVTTYQLQEARLQSSYNWFMLGSSLLGSTDHLAY